MQNSIARRALALVLAPLAVVPLSHAQSPAADLLITNAKVWTVDKSHPTAEAVAVLGDRIVAVGSNSEIAAWRGPHTKVIHAEGKLLLPGFNDAHVHFLSGGIELDSVQLTDATSQEEFARRIGERARKTPKGEWIVGGDWDETKWKPEEIPSKDLIDSLTPDTPVFVRRVHPDEPSRRADWLRRAAAYQEAGADVLFAICWTVEHARFFRSQVRGPMMTIRTLGTEIDLDRVQYSSEMMGLSVDELYQLGYQLQIEPTTLLGVAANAMVQAAARERQTGRMQSVAAEHGNLYELMEQWMNVKEVRRIRQSHVKTKPKGAGGA